MIKNDLHPSEEPLRLLEWSSRHSAPAGAMYRVRDDALYFASLFLYFSSLDRLCMPLATCTLSI
jgi:hypothetical protein